MSKQPTIALDAMGGDHAPEMVLKGAEIALVRFPQLRFQLFGQEEVLGPLLEAMPTVKAASTLHHAPDVITGDTKPSAALRTGKRSSWKIAWRS